MTVSVAAAVRAPALLSASQTYWPASPSCTLVILSARVSVTCTRPSGMARALVAVGPAAPAGPSLLRRHSTSGGGSPVTEQGNSTSAPTSAVVSWGPFCRLGGTGTRRRHQV